MRDGTLDYPPESEFESGTRFYRSVVCGTFSIRNHEP
jgi:hypothetical protein